MNDVVERLREHCRRNEILARDGWSYEDTDIKGDVKDAIAEIERLEMMVEHEHEGHQLAVDAENKTGAENAKLRQFFETIAKDVWDLHTVDGGDFQDTAERLGLIVRVPADEQFKEEYGSDEMFVWAWNPLATEALEGE